MPAPATFVRSPRAITTTPRSKIHSIQARETCTQPPTLSTIVCTHPGDCRQRSRDPPFMLQTARRLVPPTPSPSALGDKLHHRAHHRADGKPRYYSSSSHHYPLRPPPPPTLSTTRRKTPARSSIHHAIRGVSPPSRGSNAHHARREIGGSDHSQEARSSRAPSPPRTHTRQDIATSCRHAHEYGGGCAGESVGIPANQPPSYRAFRCTRRQAEGARFTAEARRYGRVETPRLATRL